VNAYSLLRWLKSPESQLDSVRECERLEQICGYLFPEIDPQNIPSEQEIEQAERKTLFNYYWFNQDNSWLESIAGRDRRGRSVAFVQNPYHNPLRPKQNEVLNSAENTGIVEMTFSSIGLGYIPEIDYLTNRLKKLETSGAPLPAAIASKEMTQGTRIAKLFEASLALKDSEALISRSYALLRTQALLAQNLVKANGRLTHSKAMVKLYPLSTERDAEEVVEDEVLGRLARIDRAIREPLSIRYQGCEMSLYNNKASAFSGLTPLSEVSFSQSQWINGKRSRSYIYSRAGHERIPATKLFNLIAYSEKDQDRIAMELIRCEESDQIMRLLSYFREDKNRLFHIKSNETNIFLRLQFIESLLFKSCHLKRQLQRSPQTVRALGEFQSDLFDYYIEEQDEHRRHYHCLWLIRLGVKLKRYCQELGVLSRYPLPPDFPDFQAQLNRVKPCHDHMEAKSLVQSLIYFEEPEEYQPEHQKEAALAICRTFFTQRKSFLSAPEMSFSRKIETNLVQQWESEFSELYWGWLPTIMSLLQDLPYRARLLQEVIKAKTGLAPVEGDSTWERVDATRFRKGQLCIDLCHTEIQGMADQLSDSFLADLKSRWRFIDKAIQDLERVDAAFFKTPDGYLQVKIERNQQSGQQAAFTLIKTVDGVRYQWLSGISSSEMQNIRNMAGVDSRNDENLWLEESANPLRTLQLCHRKTVVLSMKATLSPTNPNCLTLCEIQMGSDLLQKVHFDVFSRVLAPLSRFCPMEKIECWRRRNEARLARFKLLPFNLEFTVQPVNEGLQAMSAQYPGYALAAQQLLPHLKGVASYLVLENAEGQKKVLIPGGQWFSSIFYRFTPKLGPLTNVIQNFIEEMQAGAKKESTYHAYELTPDKQLMSDDPVALAYLIVLFLIQGEKENALTACSALEMLCKRKSVSKQVAEMIQPLLLAPSSIEGVVSIRQRLLAVLEENQQVQFSSKKEEENPISIVAGENVEAKSIVADALIGIVILQDLETTQKLRGGKRKLTDDQEWFLFKSAMRRLTSIAKNQLKERLNGWESRIKSFSWEDIVEIFCLSQVLQNRYQQLRHQFEPFYERSFIRNIWEAPSGVPNLSLSSVVSQLPLPSLSSEQGPSLIKVLKAKLRYHSDALNHERLKNEVLWSISLNGLPRPDRNLTAVLFKKHFMSYYAIARGEAPPDYQRLLRSFLELSRGGWDSETAVLIEYLRLVMKAPIFFWSVKKLESDLLRHKPWNFNVRAAEEMNWKSQGYWKAFFDHLSQRAITFHAGKEALPLLQNSATFVLQDILVKEVSGLHLVPGLQIPLAAARLGGKVYHAAALVSEHPRRVQRADASVLAAPPQRAVPSYGFLAAEDQQIDSYLDQLLNSAVESAALHGEGRPIQQEPLAVSAGDSLAVRTRLERVNGNIREYSERSQAPAGLRVKEGDLLWSLYLSLTQFHRGFKRKVEEERSAILETMQSANGDLSEPITWVDLMRCFLKGNFEPLAARSHIQMLSFAQLDQVLARHLVKATRLSQIERLVGHVDGLTRIDPAQQPGDYEGKWEQLVTELQTRRAYAFVGLAARLLRRFMVFEYSTNKMLWKKQVSTLSELLLGADGNRVIELIMGSGKTDVCFPLINAFEADGSKIVFNAFTAPLAQTNIAQISRHGKGAFDQTTNALYFCRNRPLEVSNLEAISVMLQRALELGEPIGQTKEDAQSLELLFIEQLYRYRHGSKDSRKELEPIILHMRHLLRIIRTKGKVIGDEAHVLFDRKSELNYPIGKGTTIPLRYYEVMEMCLRYVSAEPQLMEPLKANELKQFLPHYHREVKGRLAEKMSRDKQFSWVPEEKRGELIAYFAGRTHVVPEWIRTSPKFSEMGMVKGVLNVLLPLAFKRKFKVGFGRSIVKPHEEYARPYDGNEHPLEESTISNPFEAMVKTLLLYLFTGLDKGQARTLITTLKQKAKNEKEVSNMPLSATPSHQLLLRLSPTENVEEIQKHPEASLLYIRYHVRDQIRFWKLNARSDSQNFHSMFSAEHIYDTGTPYNDGCYPDDVKMLWDPGTVGEALHVIQQRCPANGVRVLQQTQPKQILAEVLAHYFSLGSDFTALIDGGALLNGVSNLDVAQALLRHASSCRPDIQAVIFFKSNAEGKDELVYLQQGGTKTYPFEQCKVPLTARWTYLDHCHGFGADVPQKSNAAGLILLGSDQFLYEWEQQAYRMRGIGKVKKLLPMSNGAVNGMQTIHFAMTRETAQLMSAREVPTVQEIAPYYTKNEANAVTEDHYFVSLGKIHNIIRRSVLDGILDAQDIDEIERYVTEFQSVLITEKEYDPGKLYGLIECQVPPREVLEQTKRDALSSILKSALFTLSAKSDIQKQLIELSTPVMPDTVQVYRDGRVIRVGDLEREAHQVLLQEQEQAQEQDAEQDQQKEVENEQHLQQDMQQKSYNPFTEWAWPKELNAVSMEWLKTRSYLDDSSVWSWDPVPPPLFGFKESLRSHPVSVFGQCTYAFDQRLWYTNNFIPRVLKGYHEKRVELGDRQQRSLYEVLVHLKQEERGMHVLSMGCLSQIEMADWQQRLTASAESLRNASTKVFLYDVRARVIVAGSQVNILALRKLESMIILEVQLKFLDGDTYYEADQLPLLKTWIQRAGVVQMRELFVAIHAKRGRGIFEGTLIQQVFDDLMRFIEPK